MAISNLAPTWAVEVFASARQGRYADARASFSRLLELVELYEGPDHPGPLKQIMSLAGLPVGEGRPPLQPVSAGRLTHIDRTLGKLGLKPAPTAL